VIVVTIRSIGGALTIVSACFGVPVLATLLASEVGLPHRIVGWLTLLLMCVLAYIVRQTLGRLLFGSKKLTGIRRRSQKSA
jgi:H+/Cl- antiporter ClcA